MHTQQSTGRGRAPVGPILIGLALALAAALTPFAHWAKAHLGGLSPFWSGELPWWIMALAVLLYTRFAERQPFASLGLRAPGGWDVGWAVIFALAMLIGMIVIDGVVFPMLHLHQNVAEYHRLTDAPFWHRVELVTRAAVCEEILFRGYILERIEGLTGSAWIGGLISWALFTYAHLAVWGAAQLIIAGFGGALLTVFYVWRRNLWSNMLTHWLVDGVGFVLMPILSAHH